MNKKVKLIIGLALLSIGSFSQSDTLSLDKCQTLARQNYPILEQTGLLKQIHQLEDHNLKTNYLPTFHVNARFLHQSDATSLNLDLSNAPPPLNSLDLPDPLYNQYRFTLDISQLIYDGGLTRNKRELIREQLDEDSLEVEIKKQQLKVIVNKVYFTTLLLSTKIELQELLKKELTRRLQVVEAQISNGILLTNTGKVLQAEIYTLEQELISLQHDRQASLNSLGILIGQDINDQVRVSLPENNGQSHAKYEISRAENKLFEKKMANLALSGNLLTASRRPTVMGFAQAGYGLPGLNMLNEDAAAFYLAGIKLNWKIWDWNSTKRKKQILKVQNEIIDTEYELFNDNIQIELDNELEQINKIEEQLSKDKDILKLRSEIVGTAKSQLENGVITASEYITELNKENEAQIKYEMRRILLVQTHINVETISGK